MFQNMQYNSYMLVHHSDLAGRALPLFILREIVSPSTLFVKYPGTIITQGNLS